MLTAMVCLNSSKHPATMAWQVIKSTFTETQKLDSKSLALKLLVHMLCRNVRNQLTRSVNKRSLEQGLD